MSSELADIVVGVVGAGAMGTGIAQVAAAAGHQVILGDAATDAVARARETVANALAREVAKGRRERGDADAVLARIRDAGDLSAGFATYSGCGLVIEAVCEDLHTKRSLFAALDGVVDQKCVLATNTSSLSIAAIAGGTAHPDRVVGMHFFNPAPVMPLVEIVPAITTHADVSGRALSLATRWKKTAVLAADTPGFIVNRIARPFYGESLRQLEEHVADVATIDWAMREIGGFRMGPFELMDFIGNDVNYAVSLSVYEGLFHDPRYRPSVIQRRLVEAELYGKKRGHGYYDYADGAGAPEPRRDRKLGESIVNRTLAMLINEAIDAVRLHVASASDIEIAMTRGVNYPRGLLAWGDEIGPRAVLEHLDALHAEYGDDRYRASPLLRGRVREGRGLLE